MLLTYFTGSVTGLIVGRLLQGMAASTWVCVSVLYASYFEPSAAVSAMGHLSLCSSIGSLSGFLFGGIVTDRFGVASIFLMAGVSALVGFALSFFIREGAAPPHSPSIKQIALVGRSAYLLLISFAGLAGQFIQGATAWGFTPQLAQRLGAGPLQISACSLFYSTPGLFACVYLLPVLVKRLGFRGSVVLLTTALAVSCGLLPAAKTLPALYAINFVQGACHSLSYSLLMGMSVKNFPEEVRTSAMGFFQSAYSIGLLLGPILMGYVAERNSLDAAFWAVGAIALAGPLAVRLFYSVCEYQTWAMWEKSS